MCSRPRWLPPVVAVFLALAPFRPASAERGYLGLAVRAADVPEVSGTGAFELGGEVFYLVPNATADRAGIELGDLLLAVDGEPFTKEAGDPNGQLRARLADRKRGDRLSLVVLKRGPSTRVRVDGRLVDDTLAWVHDLPARIDALGDGSRLELSVDRQPRIATLELELGPHPHDVPRLRPALDEARTHARLLGAPSDLEVVGRGLVERFGWGEETADLEARLRALHDSDDGYRLDDVRFVHRHPWRLPEASRDLLTDLAPAGGRALPDRIRAAAARDRADLQGLTFEPLPRGVTAEEHARALELALATTARLVGEAFVALDGDDEATVRRAWRGLSGALEEGIYLHADPDPLRRRDNLRLLELAGRVDRGKLHAAALSWSRLADPAWLQALRSDLGRDARRDETWILRRQTPLGEIVFGGRGPNRYRGFEPAIVVDLGGDDVHSNNAGASAGADRPAAAVLDLGGDDAYEATADAAQGVGLAGVGLLVDLSGDDRYLGRNWAQGAGLLGVGMLVDGGGDDTYRARSLSQAAGLWGAGWLIDASGDDRYEIQVYGQGLGLPGGFGVLHEGGGDDRLHAKGGPPTGYGTQGVFDGWAQGCGLGFRWLQSGGIGVLADDGGADDREAGNFSAGGGYYFGWGLLHDRGRGHDVNVGSRYDFGFAAHQALGSFVDDGGHDRYVTRNAVVSGLAWDECVTWFHEGGGDDTYLAGGFSLGASAHNSFSFFVDEGGTDRYEGTAPARAGGNAYHGGTSFSLFLDLGPGRDAYGSGLAVGEVRPGGEHGVAADLPGRLRRYREAHRVDSHVVENP